MASEASGATSAINKAASYTTYPEDDRSETENGISLCLEPACLGCFVRGSRCPLIEKELADIDRDPGERHRDEGSEVGRCWGVRERRGIENIGVLRVFIYQRGAVFEPRISRRVEPC